MNRANAPSTSRDRNPFERPQRPEPSSESSSGQTPFQPARKTATTRDDHVPRAPMKSTAVQPSRPRPPKLKPRATPRMTVARIDSPPPRYGPKPPAHRRNDGQQTIKAMKSSSNRDTAASTSRHTLDAYLTPRRAAVAAEPAPRAPSVISIHSTSDDEDIVPPVSTLNRVSIAPASSRTVSSSAARNVPHSANAQDHDTPRAPSVQSGEPRNARQLKFTTPKPAEATFFSDSDDEHGGRAVVVSENDDEGASFSRNSSSSDDQPGPSTSVRQLRVRQPAPAPQQQPESSDTDASVPGWDTGLTFLDKATWAIYQEGRLPFLLRNLRQCVSAGMTLALGEPTRSGLYWRDVVENGLDRWVCPVCVLGGMFSSREARDMHLRLWHESYTGRVRDNRARRAGRSIAPVEARVYNPAVTVKRAKSPSAGRGFPHISERVTGLNPMPNFGYMTDRLRLEEMRVLAQQPGGQRAFVAAWKRWIYQHRQDFIRDPASATASFLQDYAEAARVAGKDVLRAWLLALVNQRHLTEHEFVSIYGEWAKSEKRRLAQG